VSDRLDFPRGELRVRVVRGTVVNATVLGLVDLLVLAQGLIVTRLLGPEAIGLYGVVTVTTMTIVSLKRVGIDEAFVAQEAADQETEFQHAFTLELLLSAGFALVLLAAAPVVAAVYDDDRLLALTAATAYLPLAFALQSPAWVFFRRMDYARQRLLQAVVPVVAFAVTVPLAAAGVGVWSLVIGPAAGNLAGIVAALAASPYRLALRYDRTVARRYLRFSVPVFVALVAALVVAQGQILAFDVDRGLVWVGFVTLAATLSRYIDRADTIVTSTIYPAICAIRDRTQALEELFVRSNRATLLWVLPACAGAVLFAGDLIAFVLGDEWRPARGLIQGLGGVHAGGGHRDGAARLQLVLVLPRARAHTPPGRRGRGGGGGLLRAGGARPRRRRGDGLRRRPLCRGRRPARGARALRAGSAARGAGARRAHAPGRPDRGLGRRGAGAARRAVGVGKVLGPSGRPGRALRRPRRRADAAPRARPRRRADRRRPARRPGRAGARRGRPPRG
jgi:hypothetical protein